MRISTKDAAQVFFFSLEIVSNELTLGIPSRDFPPTRLPITLRRNVSGDLWLAYIKRALAQARRACREHGFSFRNLISTVYLNHLGAR